MSDNLKGLEGSSSVFKDFHPGLPDNKMNVNKADENFSVGEWIIFKDRNFKIEPLNNDVCMCAHTYM